MATLQERIAKAEERLKQLRADQQKVEARKKAAEVKRSRKEETRRKVLVGAVVLAKLEEGSYPEADFTAMMDAALTRPEDRNLFGLAVTTQEALDGSVAVPNSEGMTGDS
jgi:hypothetical protein